MPLISYPVYFGSKQPIQVSPEKPFLDTLRDNHHVLKGNPSIGLRVRHLNENNPFEGKSSQQVVQLLNREQFFLHRRLVVNGHVRKLGVFVSNAPVEGYNHRFYIHRAKPWELHREVLGPHVDHYISGDGIGRKTRRGVWEAKYRYPIQGGCYVTLPQFSGSVIKETQNSLNICA